MGIYEEGDECLFDYAISSYTPTLGALLPGSTSSASDSGLFSMAFAMESKTLRYTSDELGKVKAWLPEAWREPPRFNTLTMVEDVAKHIGPSSIVHFACHGKQDLTSPLNSALALDDGDLTVSQIIKIKESISHNSLAFLCACETAMGDGNLPDEVIHLSATLLFAGFRGAVATMW